MPSDFSAPSGPRTGSGAAGDALRILVVDENGAERERTLAVLGAELPGASVEAVGDPEALTRAVERGAFDVVVADHRLGGLDAFILLATVRARRPDAPVLLCTGGGSE